MGLLDSILGTASGKTDPSGEANSLVGILGGLLTQSGDCRAWPINFPRVAAVAHLPPGSVWAKTSPSPAIKFKNVWVPTKSKSWRQKWGLILTRHRTSWPNFCLRWWTN